MSRFSFTYELSFNGGVSWTDVTKFVDSRNTRISYPAMSGEYKSSVGQLTFTLSYKRNKGQLPEHSALFASLVNAKINNDEVRFHLLKNNRAIFTGNIDLSNLSQDIRNKPEWVNLSVYDNIRLLDENMQNEFEFPGEVFKYRDKDGNIVVYDETDGKWYYENTRIEYTGTRYPVYDPTKLWPVFKCDPQDCENDLVVQILLSQGWNMSDINFELSEPLFESDGETYSKSFAAYDPGVTTGKLTLRSYLDSLLHEFLAFLTTDGDGKFVIRRFKMTAAKLADTKGTARYLTNTRSLNIGGAPWNKDGIKLTWASPSAMKAKVYDASFSAAITYGKDEEGKETTEIVQGGFDMPGHTYWPETGYMEEVWFDFSSDWLDRQYICKVSPKRDEDLSLMSTKNPVIDAQREPEIVLAELDEGETENPTIKPLRMRTLFYNNSSAAKKFTRYKVYADCLYRAKVNTMACPESASDYDEYTSQFILSEENATDYVRGMYNFRHYGSMVYKWVQKQEAKPQDIWIVAPEGTDIATKVYVTLVDVSFENGETWYSVTAIGVSEYDSEQVSKTSSSVGAAEASQGEKGEKGDATKWSQGTQLWGESTARGVAGNQDDYYLNTETFNLYRCIQSGNSSTALWQFVGKIKGEDATFDGTLFTIEYAMSSSPESVVFEGIYGVGGSGAYGAGNGNGVFGFNNNIWSEIVDNWYRGLYIWQRIKTVSPTGEISYSEPTYCKDLTESLLASLVFDLVPTEPQWVKNLARSGSQSYTLTLKFTGYPPEYALSPITAVSVKDVEGTEVTDVVKSFSGATVTLQIPYKLDLSQLDITVTGRFEETATCSMTAKDETTYDAYGGKFATDALADAWFLAQYGGTLEGYSYVNTTTNTIRFYDGIQWNTLSLENNRKAGIVLSQAEMDFWELFESTTEEQKVKLWEMYGYKKEIIASAIAAQRIIMYGQGVIASAYVDPDPEEDLDADGFLDSRDGGGNPVPGYRFEGQNGVVRSTEGVFKKCRAKDMDVVGVLNLYKSGTQEAGAEILHPALTTVKGSKGDPTGVTSNAPARWGSAELYNNPSISADTSYVASGTYQGNSLHRLFKATQAYVMNQNYDNAFYDETVIPVPVGGCYTLSAVESSNPSMVANANNCYIDVRITNPDGNVYTAYVSSTPYDHSPNFNIQLFFVSGATFQFVLHGEWAHSRALGANDPFSITGTSNVNAAGLWVSYRSDAPYYPEFQTWEHWVNLGVNSTYDPQSVSLSMSSPVSFVSSNNIHYCNPTNLIGYTSYTVDGVTHQIELNVPYKVDGTLFVNGVLRSLSYFMRNSASSVTIGYGSSESITLDSSGWYYIACTIRIADYADGVESMALYPKADLVYDIGSSGDKKRRYKYIYCQAVIPDSRLEDKTNVVPFKANAVELLKSVGIVGFNFKSDMSLPEKDRIDHIGFIADYTDERLSGKHKDQYLMNNCIGVLIKAVQELSAEIEALKGGTK